MSDSVQARRIGRRTVLVSGLAGAAALGFGLNSDAENLPPSRPVPLADQGNVTLERVYSQARARNVDLVFVYPKGTPRQGLPVCLLLHGRFQNARNATTGVSTWLAEQVERGRIQPFAFLAVDGGGNNYWRHGPDDDDPMWMLLDEVPRWLTERNLGGATGLPFAASGMSMGGFGALLYTRRRREHGSPLTATGVVSPALLTEWSEMRKRQAFRNEAEWISLDPLRHIDALGDVHLGVWAGTSDWFIDGTRRFIELADPEIASTTPGKHDGQYLSKALPEVINFVGRHLEETSSTDRPMRSSSA